MIDLFEFISRALRKKRLFYYIRINILILESTFDYNLELAKLQGNLLAGAGQFVGDAGQFVGGN